VETIKYGKETGLVEGGRLVNENQNIPVGGIVKKIVLDKSKPGSGDV
jgi:hypothetical protein